jgi:hypothetical protein
LLGYQVSLKKLFRREDGYYSLSEVQAFGKAAPVHEPTALLLLGSGLVGLVGIGRKKLFRK